MPVPVSVSEDEKFPYFFVEFEDDPDAYPGQGREFRPNLELTGEEAADLREVRARHDAWQQKLDEMLIAKYPSRRPSHM